MCGIAGLFKPDRSRAAQPTRDRVRQMIDRIVHRGPDGEGVYCEGPIGLGHRRLAVIDIAGGDQPLFNEDRSVVVVFNGEIYNFVDLVPELTALGHQFHTHSDTEVIVHAWEQWGADCVKRFRGMFAFALWDKRQRVLFLARDRLGVKPLYYGVGRDGALVFASELKAIAHWPEIDRSIDPQALEDYLALGYVADPRSIYRGVRKLPPAHTLIWRADAAQPRLDCYWRVQFEAVNRTADEAAEELRALVDESVRIRMVSDVPIGAFLSGGVDSSVIVSSMARQSSQAVKTCAIGFDVAEFDETRYATMVAQRYHTDHVERRVTSDDFGLIDRLTDMFDEPFADSSALPTFRVCEVARARVTVALSGDGGDETFAGYRRYRMHLAEERVRSMMPQALRGPVFGLLARLYPKADWAPQVFRAKTTLRALAQDTIHAYQNSVSAVDAGTRSALYSDAFRRQLGGYHTSDLLREHAAQAQTDDPLALVQYLDYQTWMAGRMNVKVDRTSMATSLEVREPLMDHKLIEWAARLPSHLKIRGRQGKFVLKHAYKDSLPGDVLWRSKMGFSIPLARWLRGPLSEMLAMRLSSEALADSGLFDMRRIERMRAEHASGLRDWSASLWALLVFAQFLDASCAGSRTAGIRAEQSD